MTVKKSIRGFVLKIGFVIAIALSFNPVDAFTEPVVITLPVVENSELLIKGVVESDYLIESISIPTVLSVEGQLGFYSSSFPFIFRLIHYERIVKLKLFNQSGVWIDQRPDEKTCQYLKCFPDKSEELVA